MDFYVGCTFCDKAVDCQIVGEPDADCPVEALIKAAKELKDAVMGTKLFKTVGLIVDKLVASLENFH